MNIKYLTVITILFLCCVFGFEENSYSLNKVSQDDISELKILKYLPKDNKTFFISNTKSSKITNAVRTNFETTNQDELVLVKNSILAYLGVDLGTNKLEDIYNNELIISTFENNQNLKDDILFVFKIKPEKNLDDILHLSNQIDQTDKIIPIYRENKINFLNFIYRTEDNYIIASSDKKLIINSIKTSNDFKEKKFQYQREILGIKNKRNILFTKKFRESIFFNNEIFSDKNNDIIATTFDIKNKHLILKSYLLNNKKNLDILAYDKLISEENRNKNNPEVSIFSDLQNFDKNLKPLINDFQRSFFAEFNKKANQDFLILNSNKDWLITFEKNTEDRFDLSDLNKLKDFNKYTLKQNEAIYSIYSKNILEEKDDVIKQVTSENIYSIESRGLQTISNYLIDDSKLEAISKKFLKLETNKDKSAFLYAKVDIKNGNSDEIEYFSDLEDLNFLIRNIFKITNEEFLEIIRQSIPETDPILYTERSLKILS